jgi:hypothetical protein
MTITNDFIDDLHMAIHNLNEQHGGVVEDEAEAEVSSAMTINK